MNPTYVIAKILVLTLWPPVAVAATSFTIHNTLSQIDVFTWALVSLLGFMGGATSLLHKLKTETPPRLPAFIMGHMVSALFSAVCAFLLMENWDVPDLAEVPLIALSGYMGARVLEAVSDRLVGWTEDKVFKIFK